MKMVMNRNVTIKNLSGHAIKFEKDEPRHVPPEMVADVMAAGGLPAEGEELPVLEEQEPQERPIPVGLERQRILVGIFEEMVKTNAREDFTAAGLPKAKKVRDKLWFDVDINEIKDVWYKYKAGELGEGE